MNRLQRNCENYQQVISNLNQEVTQTKINSKEQAIQEFKAKEFVYYE